tara:strand:- start:1829 stop:1939 length:111 start_codon:yes stop_codon:yes gene_type:complete
MAKQDAKGTANTKTTSANKYAATAKQMSTPKEPNAG